MFAWPGILWNGNFGPAPSIARELIPLMQQQAARKKYACGLGRLGCIVVARHLANDIQWHCLYRVD